MTVPRRSTPLPHLRLLIVPYHLGRERIGMGQGPDRLLEAGAVELAERQGLEVDVVEVHPDEDVHHEIGAAFAVMRAHAHAVASALEDGAFPLTLGGNCSCTISTVAALGDVPRLGVVWFDAHGDANTPDTTISGFFDGMPMAILAGWCWHNLATTIPGFQPVPERQLLLAAARAFDPDEQQLLEASGITVLHAQRMRTLADVDGPFLSALDRLGGHVDRLHAHVDLDAIDLADGHANEFAAPNGPTLDALDAAVGHLVERTDVVAASLTSYNPDWDDTGDALRSGLRIFERLVTAAAEAGD
jgi:arginase